MIEYTWHDLIWWLEELAEMRRADDVWVVPLNPNLSLDEQMLVAYYIQHPEEFNIFDEKEDNDE